MPNHFAEKHHNPELDFTPQTISNLIYIASAAKKLAHYDEFEECVADMLVDPVVLQMNGFFQHHGVSRYEHCRMVAYYSFLLCKKLGLDARSAARAGMVHDLFLYDWRSREAEGPDSKHAYHHPQVALANAEKRFELNDREREGIAMHMWPLAKGRPQFKETYCIAAVDKYCACIELCGANRPLQRRRTRKLHSARAHLGGIPAPSMA